MPNFGALAVMLGIAYGFVHLVFASLCSFGTEGKTFDVSVTDCVPLNPRLDADELELRTLQEVQALNDRADHTNLGSSLTALPATIRYLGQGIFIITDHFANEPIKAMGEAEALVQIAEKLPTYKGHFLVRASTSQWVLPHDESEWPEITCSDPSKTLTTRVKRLVLAHAGFLIPTEEGLAEYERLNARYRK